MEGRSLQAISASANGIDLVVHGGAAGAQQTGDTWSLSAGLWAPVAQAQQEPSARTGHAMAFVPDSSMPGGGTSVLFGGESAGETQADTWTFDGNCWDTQDPASIPPGRVGHDMAYDPVRDVVVMFGGSNADADPPLLLQDTWEWDGVNWNIVLSSPSLPSPRQNHRMGFDSSTGKIVLYAGTDASGNCYDVWEYDGTQWVDSGVTFSSVTQDDFDLATDPNGGLLLLQGGSEGGGESWTLRTWTGSGFAQVAAGTDQEDFVNRADPKLTFDFAGGRLFLHGGSLRDWGPGTLTEITDVWEWTGSAWTLFDLGSPVSRQLPGMAFDEARSQLVFTGGGFTSRSLRDTYTFDGVEWTQHSWPGFTGPIGPVMGYDPVADRTILLGGEPEDYPGGGTFFAMQWDGSTWSNITLTSPGVEIAPYLFGDPSSLVDGSMVFDHARQVSVVVGGRYQLGFAAIESDDVWELPAGGTQWTVVEPTNYPSFDFGRSRFRLAYHDGWAKVVAVDDQGVWSWDGFEWSPEPTNGFPGPGPVAYDSVRGRLVLSNDTGTHELANATWLHRSIEGVGGGDDSALFFDELNNQMFGVAGSDVIRLYAPEVSWSWNTYGTACGGPEGVPMLSMITPPRQGSTFVTKVDPYPLNAFGIMGFGASRDFYDALPLPFDLSIIGMTNCFLETEVWLQVPISPVGLAIVQMPTHVMIVGEYFTQQAFVAWPGANPFGLVTSNAAEYVVGTL